MLQAIPYNHPAWIEIDLVQFKKNLYIIRDFVKHSKLCLPIKANAYGHGLVPIARAAVQSGVDYLAIACLQEGILLRQANIRIPLLVLGVVYEAQIAELLEYDIEFSISSLYKAKAVAAKCLALNKQCKVHVEIDTGMQRTGVRTETAIELLNYLAETPCFKIVGIYSHLATADQPNNDFAYTQIYQFKTFLNTHLKQDKNIICHIANSAGTCFYPEAHLDMVRPGKLAFGYFNHYNHPHFNAVTSVFSVKAHIAYFKVVAKDQGISYGHTYITTSDSRIVTIPIGFGDGFRRALSNKGSVLIRGKRYPIVGMVCMDQFMVNISQDEAYVGEEVVLLGKQGSEEIKLSELATLCDTIPSEILCNFNHRLPHFYLDKESQFWEFDTLKESTWRDE